MAAQKVILPELELAAWEPSQKTLNLYLQIVGKIQLALMPRKNHWWNITFLPNSKGLITHVMPAGDMTFEIQFNFLEDIVEFITNTGVTESFALRDGLSVADFYKQVFAVLAKLGVEAKITARPYSMPDSNPMTTPFDQLTQFDSYNAEYVHRFWHIVLWSAEVFTEFGGRFYGKTSTPQVFWHHMDLAMARFCGRRGPELPGNTNVANRDAYSHELISFGFWAGDEILRNAALYSYSYPSPPGIEREPLQPANAKWSNLYGASPMALLMYGDLRAASDPRKMLLDFLESSYCAGARLLKWDMDDMKVMPLK